MIIKYCFDCNKKLKKKSAKRCRSCASKFLYPLIKTKLGRKKLYLGLSCKYFSCKNKIKAKFLCNAHYKKLRYIKKDRENILKKNKINKVEIKSIDYMMFKRFGGNREPVLIRDNYSCTKCGITNIEHIKKWGVSISIDHIDGQGRNSKNPNNSLENLQTLCLSCHGKKDSQRYWQRKLVNI